LTYISTPDITSRFNKAAGISLGWDEIPGATGYAIYRKSYNGTDPWTRVATIEGSDTLTWIDTSVKNNNGTIYRYTIRALAGSGMNTLSGCRNTGRSAPGDDDIGAVIDFQRFAVHESHTILLTMRLHLSAFLYILPSFIIAQCFSFFHTKTPPQVQTAACTRGGFCVLM
jgi:hypothetical protein